MVNWTKRNFLIGFVLVSCVIAYQFWLGNDNQDVIEYHENLNFSSVVSKKTSGTHSRTLVLRTFDGTEQIMDDNFDASGFYNYVVIGDSLIKKKQELKIRLLRNGLDTTFWFQLK